MYLSDSDRQRLDDEIESAINMAKDNHRVVPYAASVAIDPVDLPGWLASREHHSLWYWRGRDGKTEIAGAGNGLSISGTHGIASLALARDMQREYPGFRPLMFCAQRFNAAEPDDESLQHFPNDICDIPKEMIVRKDDRFEFRMFIGIRPDSEANQIIDTVDATVGNVRQPDPSPHLTVLPSAVSIRSLPDKNGWRKMIADAVSAIERAEMEKIVLARRKDYRFAQPIDPLALSMLLHEHNRSCYTVLYQPRPGLAFISATPERLYLRNTGHISVDAISSTMPRGKTPDEDAALERELLADDKLRREHDFVTQKVIDDLTSLCETQPNVDGPQALKLERIQHIASEVTGQIKPGVDDLQIIRTLHPTPAVGGVPRERAMTMMVDMEPFTRGWYAGAIGMVDDDRAEFAVGIRSMIVRDDSISVFTGAGIVRGSNPDREWDEIESKDILRPLLPEKALS